MRAIQQSTSTSIPQDTLILHLFHHLPLQANIFTPNAFALIPPHSHTLCTSAFLEKKLRAKHHCSKEHSLHMKSSRVAQFVADGCGRWSLLRSQRFSAANIRRASRWGTAALDLHVMALSLKPTSALLQAPKGARRPSSSTSEAETHRKEEEEDKQLEEEEFRTLQEQSVDEYMPIAYRLAHKADALDVELERLRWSLWCSPQCSVDLRAVAWFGQPSSVARVKKSMGTDLNASSLGSYAKWCGSSSPLGRALGWALAGGKPTAPTALRGDEIISLSADIEKLQRVRALHRLNYYSRINLIPKRHIGTTLYQIAWNALVGVQNAIGCVVWGALRGAKEKGWAVGAPLGAICGLGQGLKYLLYGIVASPIILLPRGLWNSIYGPINFFRSCYNYNPICGRWEHCSVAADAVVLRQLQLRKRTIRAVGRTEFRRKRMQSENKWEARLQSMGFSLDSIKAKIAGKADGKNTSPNPYEVLQLNRNATAKQIKDRYKKLAMVFHPDVAQSRNGGPLTAAERAHTQQQFERISTAYQILSNPEKRKAFDLGGSQGLHLHETKFGGFMSRTPEQMVQSIFGGEAFRRRLVGELLRSHWSLRFEAQVSVSLQELEELQYIRIRQMAAEIAKMVDVHAKRAPVSSSPSHRSSPQPRKPSMDANVKRGIMEELGDHGAGASVRKRRGAAGDADSPYTLIPGTNEENTFSTDFERRTDAFIGRLADACFGKELLREVGEAYVAGAHRFLGLTPFYGPKALQMNKVFTGFGKLWKSAMEQVRKLEKEEVGRKLMLEYFYMEFDTVVADLHVVLRYAVQTVLQDDAESEEVRRKRCYALWYIGEKMMEHGSSWNPGKDDAELVAYIQQAATSSATSSAPEF